MDEAITPKFEIPGPLPSAPSAEERVEIRKEEQLAALADQPGWQEFVTGYKAAIMELRTLSGVDMATKDDAQVGQLTRAYQLAAAKMEEQLIRVEQTAAVIHEAKNEK